MKKTFSTYALSLSAAVLLLNACDGSQSPIGAAGAMSQRRVIAPNVGHLMAYPTYLTFYSQHPLKFRVREADYYGRARPHTGAFEPRA